MTILDFLFLICYSPFSKLPRTEKRSEGDIRLAALIALVPPLSFVSMGLLNIALYYLRLKPTATWVAILISILFVGLFLILNKIYVTGNREVGKPRFPIISSFLILAMIVGSIIFMAVCLAKFR